MVRGSDKTYGELMVEAREMTGNQTVGETLEPLLDRFKTIIEEAVQSNADNGVTGKYYIHIRIRNEPYTANALHIYPQCRRTRPSPYQDEEHFLWSVEDGGKITPEWNIPCRGTLKYILANPHMFDPSYVAQLRAYSKDKLENLSDYVVKGKIA